MFRFKVISISLICSVLSLTGCVTEKSYVDSNKQVKSLDFDKQEAAKSRLLLGLEYLRNKDLPQAKTNLDKALSYAPNRADIHYSLAHYYQLVGNIEQATKSFTKALSIEPNNPNTLNNYGSFLCKNGQFSQAKQALLQAIKVPNYSQVAQTYLNLAYCEIDNGEYKSALKSVTTASKHDPKSSEIMLVAASLHYAFGNFSNALSWFQELQSVGELGADGLLLGIILSDSMALSDASLQLSEQLISRFSMSEQAALVNSNNLQMSDPGVLRQKVQMTYSLSEPETTQEYSLVSFINPSSVNRVDKNTAGSTVGAQVAKSDVLVEKGVHSLNAIRKEHLLPQEEVVFDVSQNEVYQVVERTPWLEITTPKVKVPKYKVQSGENLYRISIKFNIQISTLMKWNKLKKQQVNAGELLYIRNPDVYHVVQTDEKLSIIADKLKVKLDDMMRWHNVKHDGLVKSKTRIIKVDPEQFKQ